MESTRLSGGNYERKFFTYYPRMVLTIFTFGKDVQVTQSDLQRKIGVTYSHLVESIDDMVKLGIILKVRKGRVALLTLTEEGKEMALLFSKLFPLIEKAEKKLK